MTKDRAVNLLDRAMEILLYAMIFFMPIAKASIAIIFGFAFFLFIIKKSLKPDFDFLKNPAHFFLLLFFIFCAFSLFNSGVLIKKSLAALFGKWFMRIAIFVIIQDVLSTPARIKRALLVLSAVAFLVSIDGIYQQIMAKDFFHGRLLIDGRPTAGFENQNSLGAYLAPIMILVTVLALSRQAKAKYRYLFAALACLAGFVLFSTLSRSAWLTFLVGISLFLILSLNTKKAVFIILICAAIFISIPAVQNRFIKGDYKDRVSLMQTSFAMIKAHPFLGLGLGTYMDNFKEYATIPGVYYAHNSYLQIWAESGFLSLFSFLMFVFLIMQRAIALYRRNRNYLLLGLICAAGGLLFHIFLEVHLYSLQLATFFWFMLGLLAASTAAFNEPRQKQCSA